MHSEQSHRARSKTVAWTQLMVALGYWKTGIISDYASESVQMHQAVKDFSFVIHYDNFA